ncbi:SRPBCC family protein [Intrasporangium sp. YIM S08009]|uniref:SRPBCC family protein n=1 Tax=Intrasporangium zincisolvens TaxID=3080018 RepID=UPI002B06229E|nr:SRPBCC family protein [Intrasporangium sp. YIM S08009]
MTGSVVRFESRTVIRRPASEVFERLADLPGYRQWMHRDGVFGGTELTSPPPIRAGTTYVDRTRMGRFVGEVTEHVPSTRLAFSETFSLFGRPLTQARPRYVFETDGDSTVVHHTAEAELYGFARLFRPVAGRIVTRERSHTVAALERSFEGSLDAGR